MRLVFSFMLLLWSVSGTLCQETTFLGAQFDHSYMGSDWYSGAGINLEMMFGDHFGINYSLLYNPGESDEYYFYTGGGQAASVYLIREAISEQNGLGLAISLGIISFILPESLSFRIPLARRSQLGFFLSPYGFEFVKDRTTEEEDHNISYEMGCRYYLTPNSWMYIVPQIGVKNIYGDSEPRASFGISVSFRVRENEGDP